jgi:hypothetical protein
MAGEQELWYWLATALCGYAGVWCLGKLHKPDKDEVFSPWWFRVTFVWAMCAMSLFELCAVAAGKGYG